MVSVNPAAAIGGLGLQSSSLTAASPRRRDIQQPEGIPASFDPVLGHAPIEPAPTVL
jgi:hypothetical protein